MATMRVSERLMRSESGRALRRSLLAPAVFAIFSSGLMVLAPSVASATPTLVFSAPFKHLPGYAYYSNASLGCGGSFTVQKAPRWSPHTGAYAASGQVRAGGCRPSASNAFGDLISQIVLAAPISLTAARAYSVNTTWALNVSTAWNVKPFSPCTLDYAASTSLCLLSAYVDMFELTAFIDLTNSTETYSYVPIFYEYEVVQNYSRLSCSSTCVPVASNLTVGPGLAGSATFTGDSYSNLTTPLLNASHSYEVLVELYFQVEAISELSNAKAGPGGLVSAYVHVPRHGQGARLLLLSVT